MQHEQHSTKVAGIDVGKHRLDVAVHGEETVAEFTNDPQGLADLVSWLDRHRVGKVGFEATGGYERRLREKLEANDFQVVMHQPIEVRLFARLKRRLAKSDRLDAKLIADATAHTETVKAAQDPRLAALAERFSAYEQISEQAASLKTFMEHVTLKDLTKALSAEIARLAALKRKLMADIVASIRAHDDLARRMRLLASIPGIGPVVAAALVVRMPELGDMRRGQAASLLGVAPFDRDSGQFRGVRRVAGGRSRPRRLLYLSAIAAKRCDPAFKAFAQRLAGNGKPPKVITIAIVRKLIEAANLVLARDTPWAPKPT